MTRLRLAMNQMAPILGDIDANLERHHDALRRAQAEKADLIVFPELSLTGYLVRGMVHHVAIKRDDPRLLKLARDAKSTAVVLGFVEKADDGQFFNSAAFIQNGAIVAVQRKLFLPNYGMFDEGRFFAAGDRMESFETPWGKAGMLICFDLLHPAAGYLHEQAGVRLLITISASPARGISAEGNMAGEMVFRLAQESIARLLGVMTIYVNRVGTEEGLTFWGGSMVMDPFGKVVCELPMYEEAQSICELDMETVSRARSLYPHLKEGRSEFILQEMWRIRQGQLPTP